MNPNHIHYGDWTIDWASVDPLGFDFWVGKDILRPHDLKTDIFRVKVGFFRDPNKGLKSCYHVIDLCVEEQRRVTVELVEKYSRNRHSRPSIAEIVGRNRGSTEEL